MTPEEQIALVKRLWDFSHHPELDTRLRTDIAALLDMLVDREARGDKLEHDSSAFCNHPRVPSFDDAAKQEGVTVPVCLAWTDDQWRAAVRARYGREEKHGKRG